MKYAKWVLFFIVLTIASSTSMATTDSGENSPIETKGDIEARLEEAKRVYLDYYKDSMNLDRSASILEGILEKDPKNLDALLFLSRVWLTYGYAKAPNRDEKIRVFKNGFEAAEKAIEFAPNNPDAHFFYVANLSSWAETHGVLKSLFLLPKIRREIETILKLDPNHSYGLALNGLLYYTLPGFLGGDLYISEMYLKRAVSLDPHRTTLKIHLAKTLIKREKYAEAEKVLKGVLEEKKPEVYADWRASKELAEEMIAGIEGKEKQSPPSYTSWTFEK